MISGIISLNVFISHFYATSSGPQINKKCHPKERREQHMQLINYRLIKPRSNVSPLLILTCAAEKLKKSLFCYYANVVSVV